MVRLLAAAVSFAFALLLPWAVSAEPTIFVGAGTPTSYTEAALNEALLQAREVGGATVRFKCGPQLSSFRSPWTWSRGA